VLSQFQPVHSCSIAKDSTNVFRDYCRRSTFDFNGDGLVDIIQHGYRLQINESPKRVSNSEHQVFISNGSGFAPPITYRGDALEALIGYPRTSVFDDYNNDGSFEDSQKLNNRIKPNRIERVVESSKTLNVNYSTLAGTEIYKSV